LTIAAAAGSLAHAGNLQKQRDDQLAILQQRFMRETEPVGRAKAFPKYGDALIAAIRDKVKDGDIGSALQQFQSYRDSVNSCFAALKQSGINAEKKPSGFKNLQIHLRQALAQLKNVVLGVPVTERDAFVAIQHELEAVDKELIEMLFPRRPGKRPPEQKSGR
jgi:hypothetical protein